MSTALMMALRGVALGSELEVLEIPGELEILQGSGVPALADPAFLERLTTLGGGDPTLGYRKAVFLVGASSQVDRSDAIIDRQMMIPASIQRNTAPPPEVIDDELPWWGDGIAELVDEPDAGSVVVRLRVRRELLSPMLPKYLDVAHARLRGQDVDDARQSWDEARAVRGEEAIELLTALTAAASGTVVEVDARIGSVQAEVPKLSVRALAHDVRLAAIELEEEEIAVDDSPAGCWLGVFGTPVDGIEVESLLQTPLFYDLGFEGEGEELGIVETHGESVWRRHPGFDDANGSDRHENRRWTAGVYSNPDPDPGKDHATAVASIIIGDLTSGQDPDVSDSWEQRRRSGVARKANLMGMSLASRARIVSQMTSSDRDIRAVNMAFSVAGDASCEGRSDWSRTVNELFESGVVAFKSAGNDGHASATDCRVGPPGSAIGAFTVGAYQVEPDGSSTLLDSESARGGTASEGCGRTIVSMSGPTSFQLPYVHRDDCGWIYGASWDSLWSSCTLTSPGTMPDTSGSVPMLTGAFGVFHSWYRATYGEIEPGAIHAIMLLQGDRRSESGFLSAGFDGVWGAGRLRLRMFDAEGMDAPHRWTAGSRCVGHGELVVVPVTSWDVSAAVDVMKAVTFTYDHRHDNSSTPNDRVSLRLSREIAPNQWQTAGLDESTDNKHRVFIYDPQPGRYAVILEGLSVGSDDEGCGDNSTRVWFSYMHEDSAREAAEGLGTVRPEDEDIE